MKHLDHPLRPITDFLAFLDYLIEEHGHYLYIGCVYVGLAVILWILVRPRRPRRTEVGPVTIVILPWGPPPKRDPPPIDSPFDDPL